MLGQWLPPGHLLPVQNLGSHSTPTRWVTLGTGPSYHQNPDGSHFHRNLGIPSPEQVSRVIMLGTSAWCITGYLH